MKNWIYIPHGMGVGGEFLFTHPNDIRGIEHNSREAKKSLTSDCKKLEMVLNVQPTDWSFNLTSF